MIQHPEWDTAPSPGRWPRKRLFDGLWLRARPSWECLRPDSSSSVALSRSSSPAAPPGSLPLWLGGSLAGPSGSCHQRVWLPAGAGWAEACGEVEGAAGLPLPHHPPCLSEVLGPDGPCRPSHPEEKGASLTSTSTDLHTLGTLYLREFSLSCGL